MNKIIGAMAAANMDLSNIETIDDLLNIVIQADQIEKVTLAVIAAHIGVE